MAGRLLGDEQPPPDLGVAQPALDERQHLELPPGELCRRRCASRRAAAPARASRPRGASAPSPCRRPAPRRAGSGSRATRASPPRRRPRAPRPARTGSRFAATPPPPRAREARTARGVVRQPLECLRAHEPRPELADRPAEPELRRLLVRRRHERRDLVRPAREPGRLRTPRGDRPDPRQVAGVARERPGLVEERRRLGIAAADADAAADAERDDRDPEREVAVPERRAREPVRLVPASLLEADFRQVGRRVSSGRR